MKNAEKLNRFIGIISNLKSLKQKATGDKRIRFTNLITELNTLKEKVYPERLEAAKIAYRKNKSALQLSAFELMEYNFRENSHSNVLQYLLDYNLIGDDAVKILIEIVRRCEYENVEKFIEKVQKKNYEVIREKQIEDRNRIDLFIIDEDNQFVIVIENKILAGIAERISEVEGPEAIARTQLDDYKDSIDSKYDDYDKLFILLHYADIKESYTPYYKMNYKEFKDILNSIELVDNILDDYKILLQSLINNIGRRNKIELIRTINYWENKINIEVSLNEIEQIKTLSYEHKT